MRFFFSLVFDKSSLPMYNISCMRLHLLRENETNVEKKKNNNNNVNDGRKKENKKKKRLFNITYSELVSDARDFGPPETIVPTRRRQVFGTHFNHVRTFSTIIITRIASAVWFPRWRFHLRYRV